MLLQCCSPDTGVLPIVQPKLCQVTLRSNHINTSPDRNLQKHFDSGLGFKRGNIEGAILVLSFGRAIQKKSICLNLSISLVQCKMQTVLFYKKLEWTQNSKRFLFCRHYNDWKFFTVIHVESELWTSAHLSLFEVHIAHSTLQQAELDTKTEFVLSESRCSHVFASAFEFEFENCTLADTSVCL